MAGVNLSDTSKMTKVQWALVCGQIQLFDRNARERIAHCSPKLGKAYEAGATECPKSRLNSDNTDSQSDTPAIFDPKAQEEAMCQSIKTMVRARMRCKNLVVKALS